MAWSYRRRSITVLMLNTLVIGLGLASLNFTGLGIDYVHYVIDADVPPPAWPFGLSPPADWPHMAVLGTLAGLILVLAAVLFFLRYAAATRQSRLIQDLVAKIRTDVYDKLQRLSFRFFDANESGSIINRVTGDVMAMRQFLDLVMMSTLTLLLSITIFVAYMWRIHPELTLICLAPLPVLGVTAWRFGAKVKPGFQENRRRVDALIRSLAENLYGIHVVKGFARQHEEIAKFRRANDRVTDQMEEIFHTQGFSSALIFVLSQLSIVLLLGFGGWMVVKGEFPLGGGLLVFAGLLQGLGAQVTQLAQISASIQRALTGAGRVFEVLDTPIEVDSPRDPVPLDRAEGRVEFDDVTFGYRENDPVLESVRFEAAPGEVVALLGATGAGKSSLLSLLPRFYDPQSGSVKIDGVDIRRYDLDALRQQIGLVFQESFLFSHTVAANIAFGHPRASREQVMRAAKIAQAHDFIVDLPEGYDTIIGERGSDLSGGQRQRLAIARALLLEPPILLLDDATAAIDPETEHEILQAMDAAMEGRTTLVIAHRLSMLRRADKVLVLEKGRVVQIGTHEQLMDEQGPYQEAALLQSADDESKRALQMPVGGGP